MGACLGNGLYADFDNVTVLQVGDVDSRSALVGQRVQLVGRVSHAESVLQSPFTEKQGVAIKIIAMVPSGGHGGGAQKNLFTASCCLPFYVADGSEKIKVEVLGQCGWSGSPTSKLSLGLRRTDEIFNIYRDAQKSNTLHSGGDKPGMKSQVQERPGAYRFWAAFNDGKDRPTKMTPLNGTGMSGFGNRPRMAREHILACGELVSVIGILKETPDGFSVEVGAGSILTNTYAKALKSCGAKPSAETTNPEVCPLTK